MLSDLQFYQEHLVVFSLNLLFMYNLVRGKEKKKVFFTSSSSLKQYNSYSSKLDQIKHSCSLQRCWFKISALAVKCKKGTEGSDTSHNQSVAL